MKFKLLLAFVMMGCTSLSGAQTAEKSPGAQPPVAESAPAPVISAPAVVPVAPSPATAGLFADTVLTYGALLTRGRLGKRL